MTVLDSSTWTWRFDGYSSCWFYNLSSDLAHYTTIDDRQTYYFASWNNNAASTIHESLSVPFCSACIVDVILISCGYDASVTVDDGDFGSASRASGGEYALSIV